VPAPDRPCQGRARRRRPPPGCGGRIHRSVIPPPLPPRPSRAAIGRENISVDAPCFVKVLRDECLDRPILTRPHAPRHLAKSHQATPPPPRRPPRPPHTRGGRSGPARAPAARRIEMMGAEWRRVGIEVGAEWRRVAQEQQQQREEAKQQQLQAAGCRQQAAAPAPPPPPPAQHQQERLRGAALMSSRGAVPSGAGRRNALRLDGSPG
jgi:hypothetical protein